MSRDPFHQPGVLKAPSNLALNPAREGAATAPLGSLGQAFTTRRVKNFFLISNLNLPSFSLKPLPLVLLYSLRARYTSQAEKHCLQRFGSASSATGAEQALTQAAGAANVPSEVRSLHRCGGIYLLARMSAGRGNVPQRELLGCRPSLCWRSYLQRLAWLCCTALFAILSYLSICYFYFKFKEGIVFPKAYLLYTTRLV